MPQSMRENNSDKKRISMAHKEHNILFICPIVRQLAYCTLTQFVKIVVCAFKVHGFIVYVLIYLVIYLFIYSSVCTEVVCSLWKSQTSTIYSVNTLLCKMCASRLRVWTYSSLMKDMVTQLTNTDMKMKTYVLCIHLLNIT